MEERILYPVCVHRNVPAAFECFLGPDSRGIERFFEPGRFQPVADAGAALIPGTVLVVKHTLASRSRAPERAAPLFDFRRPVYSA